MSIFRFPEFCLFQHHTLPTHLNACFQHSLSQQLKHTTQTNPTNNTIHTITSTTPRINHFKMMSFYPRSFYTPVSAEASFVPLFRLLDDFDTYSRQAEAVQAGQAAHSCAQRRQQQRARQTRPQRPTFNPRFDVRETEDSYELHGELAGLERENVNVEFTDHETLVIRGRVERSYGQEAEKTPETTEPAAVEAAPEAAAEATPSETETTTTEPEKRRHSHQATVEDDPEDENTPSSSRAASPKPEAAKPAAETQEVAKPAPAEVQQPQQQRRYKRWERSVGEFSRAFTFPAPIDHENVSATMNNGILSVTVPKAKKPVARRIQISF